MGWFRILDEDEEDKWHTDTQNISTSDGKPLRVLVTTAWRAFSVYCFAAGRRGWGNIPPGTTPTVARKIKDCDQECVLLRKINLRSERPESRALAPDVPERGGKKAREVRQGRGQP